MGRRGHTRWRALALFFVLMTPVARTAAAGPITVMWDPSTNTAVTGYVVYVGTESGVYTRSYDVGNATYYVLSDAVAGQSYYFTVASYVPGPILGDRSPEVLGLSDEAPTLINPGPQTSVAGAEATLQLTGSDPVGQPVSYSAEGLPPGMDFIASTGSIAGTPTTAGTYLVTATVSDGVLTDSQAFTWTVSPASADTTAPTVTITLPTTAETFTTNRSYLTLGGTAVDDGLVTEVTWSNGNGSEGRATGTENWIAGIPLQRGANYITVQARDEAGNLSSRAIVVKARGRSR